MKNIMTLLVLAGTLLFNFPAYSQNSDISEKKLLKHYNQTKNLSVLHGEQKYLHIFVKFL